MATTSGHHGYRPGVRALAAGSVGAAAALGVVLLVSGCSTASSATGTGSPPGGSQAANSAAVLTDSAGRTIYVFAADAPNRSACSADCLQSWPAANPASLATAPVGSSAALGHMTRPDGTQQLTVNGYPAYLFAGDAAPGQVNGQGKSSFGGVWWAVTPSGAWATTAPTAAATKSSGSAGRYS